MPDDNQQLLEDMGKYSFEYFKFNFDFDIVLNKYLHLYNKNLKQHNDIKKI